MAIASELPAGSIFKPSMFAAGVVDSRAIGDGAVGNAELANGSVNLDKLATNIPGSFLADSSIAGIKLNPAAFSKGLALTAGVAGINNTVAAGTVSGFSYNAQGLITGAVALATKDLRQLQQPKKVQLACRRQVASPLIFSWRCHDQKQDLT